MITVLRKLSMHRESYTGAAGNISNHWRSNCFFNIETEGAKTRCAGSLFQYFTTRAEKTPLLRRRRLGPCSNRLVCHDLPRGLANTLVYNIRGSDALSPRMMGWKPIWRDLWMSDLSRKSNLTEIDRLMPWLPKVCCDKTEELKKALRFLFS